jgi:hypothetical protein
MSWFPSWPFGQKSLAQAEADLAKAQQAVDEARSREQGEALSGPEPSPAMGGRRRNKKTRRAKKGKSRKERK